MFMILVNREYHQKNDVNAGRHCNFSCPSNLSFRDFHMSLANLKNFGFLRFHQDSRNPFFFKLLDCIYKFSIEYPIFILAILLNKCHI